MDREFIEKGTSEEREKKTFHFKINLRVYLLEQSLQKVKQKEFTHQV